MANLPLSLIFSPNERVQSLLNGDVRPAGIELSVTTAPPSEIFFRQLRRAEFDVSEMSLSSLTILTARGPSPWVALPIFPIRRFFHAEVLVRADSAIERPSDLRGKRIGLPDYQQTAAVWVRGALQHEFGVAPDELTWYMERGADVSHAGATGFQPPPGLTLQQIPPDENIASRLLGGALDAVAFFVFDRNALSRSSIDIRAHPAVRPLFPDPQAEGVRYYRATGLLPINHVVVVRRTVLERHPWVALNLYQAFVEAKERMLADVPRLADPFLRQGLLPLAVRAGLTGDPFPYGVRANRLTLETLARYSHEQGLTPRVVALDELFAPCTLEL